jgi:endonuclease YncB( thermonuclease family)
MNRFIILLLLGFSASVIADINGKVVVVTDGDTIRVLDANRVQHKIRLAGIDAPERGQPFGNASRKYLASLVAGKAVRIESTKKDRYGRVLGKVWVQPRDCPSCGKTLNANHAQILAGMAWRYLDYVKDLSPEDRGRYESAEAEARKRKRGLWSEANAIPPWAWRRGQRNSSVNVAPANFQCGSKRYCREMTSCKEAIFYHDGLPCSSICR